MGSYTVLSNQTSASIRLKKKKKVVIISIISIELTWDSVCYHPHLFSLPLFVFDTLVVAMELLPCKYLLYTLLLQGVWQFTRSSPCPMCGALLEYYKFSSTSSSTVIFYFFIHCFLLFLHLLLSSISSPSFSTSSSNVFLISITALNTYFKKTFSKSFPNFISRFNFAYKVPQE